MKRFLFLAGLGAALMAAPVQAVDHNNLDAGRPLGFDDANALAFGEQALEVGLGLGWPRNRPLGLDLDAEYLYGFARNSHLNIGFDPSIGGRSGEGGTGFDFGDVSLGLFHNFNRQYNGTPAFSLRGDVYLPTGRDSQGVGFRLRGIASKQTGQYGTLHLNLDLNANPSAGKGERELYPGLSLGYSRPLGYPTRFDTTGLAMLSVQPGARSGSGPVIGVGLGLRKQVSVRSVLDVGIQADLVGSNGAPRDRLRLVAGYSIGF